MALLVPAPASSDLKVARDGATGIFFVRPLLGKEVESIVVRGNAA